VEIVRTFGTDAFMYVEEFVFFLGDKGIAAVRVGKAEML
jgi:hypothetical protein